MLDFPSLETLETISQVSQEQVPRPRKDGPRPSDAAPLVSAGFALHWLRIRSKAPAQAEWSGKPVATIEELSKSFREGQNLGVRLGEWSSTESGYGHLIDLDIRDESKRAEAYAKLSEYIDYKTLPCVKSGSGGSSRHFYFFCDTPFPSKKLAHSKTFQMVLDEKKQRDVKKWDWEIELFGTGKQAVIPPSIHPDTGNPYTWERELPLNLIEMGVGPSIDADRVESWGVQAEPVDSLAAPDQVEPLGLELSEAASMIADLTDDWVEDRDQWLQVGMAMHHEFAGSPEAFDAWAEWSAQSEKFDLKDARRVWKSFGESRGRPVRMATIKKEVVAIRMAAEFGDLEDLDDEPSAPATVDRTAALLDDSPDDRIALLLEDYDADLVVHTPDDLYNVNHGAVDFDHNWVQKLQLTEDGAVRVTLHNIALIMKNDPRFRGIVSYNEFTQENVVYREPGRIKMKKESPKGTLQLDNDCFKVKDKINGDLWQSQHDSAVRFILEAPPRQGGFGIKVSKRDLTDAIELAAHERPFHPIRQALEMTKWDGKARLDHLFVDYLGTPDTAYYRDAARYLLVAAVARVYEPGHKFDTVPVLEGTQGRGKSTFCRVLAMQDCWFSELQGKFSDAKEMIENMQGALVLELPELQGLSKAEVTDVKAFISRQRDKARMAYATRVTEYPRQSIIIGTTNEDAYLRDQTGGRRFWPIRVQVDQINTGKLKDNVLQIWAEAVEVYRQMRREQPKGTLPLYLRDEEAVREAQQMQETRRIETVEEGMTGEIEQWLNTPIGDGFDDLDGMKPRYRDYVSIKDVWVDFYSNDPSRLDQRTSNAIGKAIRDIDGWSSEPVHKRTSRGTQRCYFRLPTKEKGD